MLNKLIVHKISLSCSGNFFKVKTYRASHNTCANPDGNVGRHAEKERPATASETLLPLGAKLIVQGDKSVKSNNCVTAEK